MPPRLFNACSPPEQRKVLERRGGVVKRDSGMAPPLLETRAFGENYSICDGSVYVCGGIDPVIDPVGLLRLLCGCQPSESLEK